jgi:2-desacetyl-2-hydroxyethyl bacteriochlorophyllide A dehydrogenase
MTAEVVKGEELAHALWMTGPRSLELRSELVPPPGPDDVLVRTLVSGISQGTELLVYRGDAPRDLPLDLPTLAGSFGFPIKYGYALVGCIEAVGSRVTNLARGDHVFVHHPHQNVFTVAATMPIRLPNDLDPEVGVFVANLETAVNVILDTPVHLGETAAVFGLGVVGQLIAQLLQRSGASLVVAVDPLPNRRALATSAGIGAVMSPEGDVVREIRQCTDGRGADVVVEASGNGAALQAAIDAVAEDGVVMAVSWYGLKPVSLALGGHFHRGRVTIRSSQVGRLNPALSPRWDRARRTALVQGLLPSLHLAQLITHRVPLERAADAYHLLDQRADTALQVVLTYSSGG